MGGVAEAVFMFIGDVHPAAAPLCARRATISLREPIADVEWAAAPSILSPRNKATETTAAALESVLTRKV